MVEPVVLNVLFNIRFPKIPEVLVMVCVAVVDASVMLPVPEWVAAFTTLPATEIVFPPSAKVPDVIDKSPRTVVVVTEPASVSVPDDLFTVKLFKPVAIVPLLVKVCPPAPLNIVVLFPGVYVQFV